MTCIKKDGQPKENGYYLAFISLGADSVFGYLGGYWRTLEYNDGHWNCFFDRHGNLNIDAEMTDSITHWEYLPKDPEVAECLL